MYYFIIGLMLLISLFKLPPFMSNMLVSTLTFSSSISISASALIFRPQHHSNHRIRPSHYGTCEPSTWLRIIILHTQVTNLTRFSATLCSQPSFDRLQSLMLACTMNAQEPDDQTRIRMVWWNTERLHKQAWDLIPKRQTQTRTQNF